VVRTFVDESADVAFYALSTSKVTLPRSSELGVTRQICTRLNILHQRLQCNPFSRLTARKDRNSCALTLHERLTRGTYIPDDTQHAQDDREDCRF
jgi:hypothetical protein